MPANSTHVEPVQEISNSFYSQVLFQQDATYGVNSGSPPKEYLTRIISNELTALCPIGK